MAKNTVEMTKAAITEVTHDPLKGKKLAPLSSACTGLSTAALPNAAGAVGLAEAGFVRKVLPTKVLSSTNMEFEGDLVRGWRGNTTTRSSPAGCGCRPCTVPAVFRRGQTSAASAGSPGTISTSRAGSRRCHNTRRDPIRATRSGTRLVHVYNAVAHAEQGRRFTIAIVAAEAIIVPPNDDRLGRSPSAPPSRSVSQ